MRKKWGFAALGLLLFSPYPAFSFINGQYAANVLGISPSNFTTANPFGTASQSQTSLVTSVLYDSTTAHERLFAVDNYRILVYDLSGGVTSGMNASWVLGEPDFTSNNDNLNQSGFGTADGLAYDAPDQWLFVADTEHNRVLVYDLSGGITNGMNASLVLGQVDFNSQALSGGFLLIGPSAPPAAANGMAGPVGLAYDAVNRHLFVADNYNNRVLVFVLPATLAAATNGMAASFVIGQEDFTHWWSGPLNLFAPMGLAYDPTHQWLWVADNNDNRVVAYDLSGGLNPPNGVSWQQPSYVLGQSIVDANSFSPFPSQNNMWMPITVDYDPIRQRVFVGDIYRRVTEFDLWGGVVNDMNAAHMLGQSDFISKNQATAQNGFTWVAGVSYDPSHQQLFVADRGRVLVFSENNLAPAGTPNACGVSGPGLQICGTVTAAEDGTTPLPGIPVELRDWQGELLTTQKTNGSGAFSFTTNLAAGSTYYVTPVTGRTQSSSPLHFPVQNLPSIGAVANLQIRGWPWTLQVNAGAPGSFILVSLANYSGTDAPILNPGAGGSGFYTTIAKADGTATLSIPQGSSYYLTCWQEQFSGASAAFTRDPAVGSSASFPVGPTQPNSAACP